MNTQQTAFRSGSIVWVSTGEPAYETEGSHIARVIDVKDNIATLQHLETGELEYHRTDRICEVCPFPVDEKNILSDFITEEVLEYSSSMDNVYLGWFIGYPLYCKVNKDGTLLFRNLSGTHLCFDDLRRRFNDLFDCDPNNQIVSSKVVRGDTMTVKFYSFYN